MEKFAKFLLAILSFAAIILFILYLLIPLVRPKTSDEIMVITLGIFLFAMALAGGAILLKLTGLWDEKNDNQDENEDDDNPNKGEK